MYRLLAASPTAADVGEDRVDADDEKCISEDFFDFLDRLVDWEIVFFEAGISVNPFSTAAAA